IWSIAYTWVNTSQHSPGAFAKLALFNILTGNASYQLYYILLTLQLYLVLPLFLLFLKHIKHHPWRALSISFVLQVLFMYADYRYLQQGTLASSGVWQVVAAYQDRFLLTYPALPFRTPLPEATIVTTPISSAGCGKPVPALTGKSVYETLFSGGLTRTYLLHVPTGYQASSSAAVVMDFHGHSS